jgi:dipeptidyl aminopeptidase/acylaminoacyl peptidase
MYRRRRRTPILLVGVLGLVLGLAAAAVISLPRVTGHSPVSGASDVSAAAPVEIVFSQAMRRETVEPRLHIQPAREGIFHWSGRSVTFLPSEPWGEGERVTIRLDAGAISLRGLPTLSATQWGFTTGSAKVAYLWPTEGQADLYAWPPSGEAPQALIDPVAGVEDFSVSQDGEKIPYTSPSPKGTEIRILDLATKKDTLVWRCPPSVLCRGPVLSLDDQLLAYEQQEARPDGSTLQRVWVTPVDRAAPRLVAAEDHPTSGPAWSSRGWLVVYDQSLAAYVLFDRMDARASRQAFLVPNGLGEPAAWSPDGTTLVYPEITFLPESTDHNAESPPQFFSHLHEVRVDDGSETDISGDANLLVEDSGPAFSPDGQWIVFSRRSLSPASWTPGRQIWRMRADGSEPTRLTDEPELNHAAVSWSPDGTRLAFVLFDQLNPTQPSRMAWSWADGRPGGPVSLPEANPRQGGYTPRWIP